MLSFFIFKSGFINIFIFIKKGVDLMELNRDALLVYLGNLKVLESFIFASQLKKEKLKKAKAKVTDKKERFNAYYKFPHEPVSKKEVEKGNVQVLSVALWMTVGAAFLISIGLIVGKIIDRFFFFACIGVGIASFILGIINYIRYFRSFGVNKLKMEQYQKEVDEYYKVQNKTFKEIDERIEEIELSEFCLANEIDKVKTMLKNAYSMDIIPVPYRNLNCISFLYDFFMKSNESLANAFLHVKNEVEINKLDASMESNCTNYISMLQNNHSIFEQNATILFAFNSIEIYSVIAAINNDVSILMQNKQFEFQAVDFIVNEC